MTKKTELQIDSLNKDVVRLTNKNKQLENRLHIALIELELVYERHGYVDDVIDERHKEAIQQCKDISQ